MRELKQEELNTVNGGNMLDLLGSIDIDFDKATNMFTMFLDGDIDFEYDLSPIISFFDKMKSNDPA